MDRYKKNLGTESTENLTTMGRAGASKDAVVVGTTQLFEGGQMRYIPMPTPDPKGMTIMSNRGEGGMRMMLMADLEANRSAQSPRVAQMECRRGSLLL
jgi:hypothetical protein